MSLQILLASTNPAKIHRLSGLFQQLEVDLLTPQDLTGSGEGIEENGMSHLAVACSKAANWSKKTKAITIATDGGVLIPILGKDWESYRTKRNTGGAGTDDETRAKRLLKSLQVHPHSKWRASFCEAIAVAREGIILSAWESTGLDCHISDSYTPSPERQEGFWVYGLLQFPEFDKNYWDLTIKELEDANDPWLNVAPKVLVFVKKLLARSQQNLEGQSVSRKGDLGAF